MKYIAVLDSDDKLSEEAIKSIKNTVFCGDEQAPYVFDVDSVEEVTDQTRKKGKWIDIMVGDMPAQACDQCNTFYPLAYTGGGHKYCPNCGSFMMGSNEE